MSETCTRVQSVLAGIADAAKSTGRSPASVSLLAVSKAQSPMRIREAYDCGLRCFGENYAQEALAKIEALRSCDIEWHFIGPVQANKTRGIAERFAWVHTLDREKIAKRLSDQRPVHLPPINVCLQVNVSGESSKSGVAIDALPDLAACMSDLSRLRLRGLMAIGAAGLSDHAQRRQFERVRLALGALNASGWLCDTLSMGMSDDYRAAIAEGATIVRMGTALFGPRG